MEPSDPVFRRGSRRLCGLRKLVEAGHLSALLLFLNKTLGLCLIHGQVILSGGVGEITCIPGSVHGLHTPALRLCLTC